MGPSKAVPLADPDGEMRSRSQLSLAEANLELRWLRSFDDVEAVKGRLI